MKANFFYVVLLPMVLVAEQPESISYAGEISVLTGNAQGRLHQTPEKDFLNEPFALDFDRNGVLYVVEFIRGNRVMRTTQPVLHGSTHCDLEPFAGMFHQTKSKQRFRPNRSGPLSTTQFHGMHDVAVGSNGKLYLADTFNHCIRILDIAGVPKAKDKVDLFAGNGNPGFSGDGQTVAGAMFNQPYCTSLSPNGERLLIADLRNQRLRSIDLQTDRVTTIAGNGKAGKTIEGAEATQTPLAGPRAACEALDGTIYLVLRAGNSLAAIRNGVIQTVVNVSGKAGYGGDDGPARQARLAGPKYVCMDKEQRVLIVDTENHCIRCFDPRSGKISLAAGVAGKPGDTIGDTWTSTNLQRPHGVRIAPDGRLLVADSENDRILIGPAVPDHERSH